jgi:uncharacterized protein (DUF58 family)
MFSREGFRFLFVLLFVFAAAWLGDVNLLLVVAGMLVGVLALNWRLVGSTLRGLEVQRRIPRSVSAGDLLSVHLEVGNERRFSGSWAVVVREQIEYLGSLRETLPEQSIFFSYIPARQWRRRVYRARLPQRGRYRFAPSAVSTRFPFGFCRHTVILGEEQTLVVYPRLGRLMPRWLARRNKAFEGTGRREQRNGLISGEFYGVRPWRQGDARRHIHWRSSARHGALVVRQYEQHRNRDLALVVDLWQPDAPGPEDLDNVELAVSFAATIVADTCRRAGGNLLLAISVDREEPVRGSALPFLMDEAMERLAVAEASSEERLAETIERMLAWIETGTEVILITTREADLTDAARFARLREIPAWRTLAPRIRAISTADAELSAYFEPQ